MLTKYNAALRQRLCNAYHHTNLLGSTTLCMSWQQTLALSCTPLKAGVYSHAVVWQVTKV